MESTTIATSSTVGSVAALEPTSPPSTSQLLVSANQVTTLTAQDLQDSLVEQSLSETILLQNVTFDSNLFDGLNLELSEGAAGGGGAASANTNSVSHHHHQLGTTIDLSSMGSDSVTQQSLDQLNLLETLEMQIIKEVQQHQQQSASSSSQYLTSSSSDPLVSSTTTIYAYEKSDEQQMLTNADSTNFKNAATINFSGAFSTVSKSSPMSVKSEPSDSHIVKGEGGQLLAERVQQQQSVILQRTSDASTSTTSSIADLANFAATAASNSGEKAIYLTGPICSTGSLSLANMKVVGQNVVAIISGDQQQQEQRLQVDACKQGPSPSSEGIQVQAGHQHQQTRLIIIEEKKQQPTLTLTTTTAASTASTVTRPSKESKAKSDSSKSSTAAAAKSNNNSASSVKEAKGKWKGKLTFLLRLFT